MIAEYELENIRFITRAENNRTSSTVKLNKNIVKRIRLRLGAGISQRELAIEMNIKRHLIADVSAGRAWSHI